MKALWTLLRHLFQRPRKTCAYCYATWVPDRWHINSLTHHLNCQKQKDHFSELLERERKPKSLYDLSSSTSSRPGADGHPSPPPR